MAVPDQDLVFRALHADQDAFAELVRRHQSPLRAWLRRLTSGDSGWADDVAQETFLRAYRYLGTYRAAAKFSTWLFGIAFNEFRRSARARRDLVPIDEQIGETLVSHQNPIDDALNDLHEAIQALAVDQRAAITLCYQQGMTHEEAAAVLKCPLGTVKTNIFRAKERLRRAFRTRSLVT